MSAYTALQPSALPGRRRAFRSKLTSPTPVSRTLVVYAEARTQPIAAEPRTFTLFPENRTAVVEVSRG